MSDLYRLLGADFVCEQCGRRHAVNVRHVVYADDALEQMPELCASLTPGRRVRLLADSRTYDAAGASAHRALTSAGFRVADLIVPDPAPDHEPVCDDITRAWVEQQIDEPDLFVAVGSGVINDLTKWIAGDRELPYASVATAASMNGYASDNIAPTLKGVKSLLYGTAPAIIATTPGILAGAPPEMTAAGLGDVIAKPVSTSDWHINKVLFDEYYCPFCAGLVNEIEPVYMGNPEAVRDCTAEGIRGLFDALIFTGLSMCMAGTSSPASGGEHLISHTLDMMAMRDDIRHDLHGRQVGVGTVFGAALYEEIMALESPEFKPRLTQTDPAFWGRFTDSVGEQHRGKNAKTSLAVQRFRENPGLWDTVRETVAPALRSPETIRDVLIRGDGAYRLDHIGVTRERFLEVLTHAHEIRERFTVLDLARCAGVLPARAEDLVDRWLI
jgi:glycerol-1-phosphate dehydrogenase [NAD(P)+]